MTPASPASSPRTDGFIEGSGPAQIYPLQQTQQQVISIGFQEVLSMYKLVLLPMDACCQNTTENYLSSGEYH